MATTLALGVVGVIPDRMSGKRPASEGPFGEQTANHQHQTEQTAIGVCKRFRPAALGDGANTELFRNAVENLLKFGQQPEQGQQHPTPHLADSATRQPQANRPWDGDAPALSLHASMGLRMPLPAHLAAAKPGDVNNDM
ncbi:hypothetical protein T484DRAFT_1800055 [Baffinella frigidus]|nr:hypothetical protein T484DRAFT_1800055 [Cryptophyta sp. CCMP2293]